VQDFVGAKFYCPHALAGGHQCIQIRKKMLEFFSTVLATLSPYLSKLAKLFNKTVHAIKQTLKASMSAFLFWFSAFIQMNGTGICN